MFSEPIVLWQSMKGFFKVALSGSSDAIGKLGLDANVIRFGQCRGVYAKDVLAEPADNLSSTPSVRSVRMASPLWTTCSSWSPQST